MSSSVVKTLTFFAAATVLVPTFLLWSPVLSLVAQFLEGCWLASAVWILVNTSQSRVRALEASLESAIGIGRLQPAPVAASANTNKKGPLDMIVSVPAYPLVWLELQLRSQFVPPRMRLALLNLGAFLTTPLWFLIITGMHMLLLAAVTAISLGVLLPWTGPVLVAVSAYLLFVPVWVTSTYLCAAFPMFAATVLLPSVDGAADLSRHFLNAFGFSMPFQIQVREA